MPIYEYRCKKGHTLEVMQRMGDPPLSSCTTCEAPVQRVFHPVAVHFKGSGFYNTDYGKKSAGEDSQGKTGEDSKPKESTKEKSDSSTNSKPESSTDTKSKT